MAKIIAGIAASHTPTIGFAKDTQEPSNPVWSDVFKVFKPLEDWVSKKKPDVILVIYNDHITSFFFDHYSPFALGVDTHYNTADEGGGAREHPPLNGHAELSRHIASSLMADEFDISIFQNKPIDHGLFSPISMITDRGKSWSGSIVPLQVGVLQFPIPTAKRCYSLGKALKRAIESFDDDISVAILATGGLSHQVHGERAGYNDLKWDSEFLERLEHDPESLTGITHAEYAKLGGAEGAEVIMWLIMRGALSKNVTCTHKAMCLPSLATISTVIFEESPEASAESSAISKHKELIAKQLKGIEDIEGTYPFTLEVSHRAYRLNSFLHKLIQPSHREQFISDPISLYESEGLSEKEAELLESRDWLGMIHYGVIFFCLEKLAAVLGIPNPEVYAKFRGETIEEYQASRNVSMSYSVAGGEQADKMAKSDQ